MQQNNNIQLIDSSSERFSSYWSELGFTINSQQPDLASEFSNYSYIVVDQGVAVAGCKVSRQADLSDEGSWCLKAQPKFSKHSLDSSTFKLGGDAEKVLYEHFDRLIAELNPPRVELTDELHCGLMSPVSQQLITAGAMPLALKVVSIDLAQSPRALMREMSGRTRSYIQWGLRHYIFDKSYGAEINLNEQEREFSDYVFLSVDSKTSYTAIHDKPAADHCFSVFASDSNGLVASMGFAHLEMETTVAGYFQNEASIPSALYSLIWMGIMEAQKRGQRHLRLEQPLAAGQSQGLDICSFGEQSSQVLRLNLSRIKR